MSRRNTRFTLGLVSTGLLVLFGSLMSVPTAHAAVAATWVRQIGRPGHAGLYAWGAAHGQFRRPTALAFDAQGRLYVTDSANERVEAFHVD